MTLHESGLHRQVVIEKILCSGETRKRMLEMGVIRGAAVQVTAVAPLGDPIEIEIKGYKLSLRKAEAQQIEVKAVADD